MLKKLTFDVIFKTLLLSSIVYFLILLTNIAIIMKNNLEVGRYQLDHSGNFIIDTKTGKKIDIED